PEPLLPWSGVRKAQAFAPACMQCGVSMPGEAAPEVSEDCLYLNIWAPAHTGQGPLPVIVWLHGGGYKNGSAAMPLYHGDRLATQGVIVVTVGYRLGALGFLALPELTQESARQSSGNYGLLDQMAALGWVQRNIAAFGGDPQRVTIAGQSSGAMSVSALIASPRAKGLFQGAIAQSGGILEPLQLAPSYLLPNAEQDGTKFMQGLGVTSLAELRRLPAGAFLVKGADAVTHPVIEPDVLPLSPYEAYVQGKINDVPLLLGSNAEEARSLTDVSEVKAATFEADINRSFGALPPALLAAYPHASDGVARAARLAFERDLRFGWDMWAWARLHAAGSKYAAYYYTFDQNPPFPKGSIYAGRGASHFAELWYMSDHLDQWPWQWTRGDRLLAQAMARYWVNFAKTGDPNGAGLPSWPKYAGGKDQVQHLGTPVRAGEVGSLESLKSFDAVYDMVRGKPFGTP
ncbi:carboxylesterase/lipase family protein, partial [Chitinimonas sp.]|uniref:carboxylesterase/lipase family protein n=1 Tax=Chitinimonas sp. TaxID=1934313 RepID=UPI002F95558A